MAKRKRDECPRCMTRHEADCIGMNDDPKGIIPYRICRFCENISEIPIYSDGEAKAVIELLRRLRAHKNRLFGETADAALEMRRKIQANINSDNPLRYE